MHSPGESSVAFLALCALRGHLQVRDVRGSVRVCLSVFPVCIRVSVPKTGFNTSDPTLGWAQWFLLCPVQGRVPVNLFSFSLLCIY